MHAVRLPTISVIAAVTVAAGCSSRGGTGSASTPPPSSPSVPVPSTALGPTAVGLPIGSPSVTTRTPTRPAGAKPVDFGSCSSDGGVITLFIQNQIFGTGSRNLQLVQLDAVPDLYTELNTIGAQYNVDTPSNICPT
jgi:hypothetical protein